MREITFLYHLCTYTPTIKRTLHFIVAIHVYKLQRACFSVFTQEIDIVSLSLLLLLQRYRISYIDYLSQCDSQTKIEYTLKESIESSYICEHIFSSMNQRKTY